MSSAPGVRSGVKRVRSEVKRLCDQQLARILDEVAVEDARRTVGTWRRRTAELQQQWEAAYVSRMEEMSKPDGLPTTPSGADSEQEPKLVDGQCVENARQFVARLSRLEEEIAKQLTADHGAEQDAPAVPASTEVGVECAVELRAQTEKQLDIRALRNTEDECRRELASWETFLKSKYLEDMQLALREADRTYNAAEDTASDAARGQPGTQQIHHSINAAVEEKLAWFQEALAVRTDRYRTTFAALYREARVRTQADADVPLLCRYLPTEANVLAAIDSVMAEARELQAEITRSAAESARLACKLHLLKNDEVCTCLLQPRQRTTAASPSRSRDFFSTFDDPDYRTPAHNGSERPPSRLLRDMPTTQLLRSP